MHRTYTREYDGKRNREKREKLNAGQGEPEEIERYQSLRRSSRAYERAERRIHADIRGAVQYTPEEHQQLQALYNDRNTYRKEFMQQPQGQAKKRALERGEGSAEEIERMYKLRDAYNTYQNIYLRGRRRALPSRVQFTPDMLDNVLELEILRDGRNAYEREFVGKANEEKRNQLEAGNGDPKEIQRMKELHEIWKAYNRAYKKGARIAQEARKSGSRASNPETPSGEIKTHEGRRRYFGRYSKTKQEGFTRSHQPEQPTPSEQAKASDAAKPSQDQNSFTLSVNDGRNTNGVQKYRALDEDNWFIRSRQLLEQIKGDASLRQGMCCVLFPFSRYEVLDEITDGFRRCVTYSVDLIFECTSSME